MVFPMARRSVGSRCEFNYHLKHLVAPNEFRAIWQYMALGAKAMRTRSVHSAQGFGLKTSLISAKEYKPYHIQDLQHWQDKANEAVMVLEANTDVLKSIHKFYLTLVCQKDFP